MKNIDFFGGSRKKPFKFRPVKLPTKKSVRKISKKNLTWPQAQVKYPKVKMFGDADRDGKLNMFDCKPFDKKRHGGKSTKRWRTNRKKIVSDAVAHFKNKRFPNNFYKSKYILPSGKTLTLGTQNHDRIEEATGLSKRGFMRATGAVAVAQMHEGKIVTGMNLDIKRDIPLTEMQKKKLKTLAKKPFKQNKIARGGLFYSYQIHADVSKPGDPDKNRVVYHPLRDKDASRSIGSLTYNKDSPQMMIDEIEEGQTASYLLENYDKISPEEAEEERLLDEQLKKEREERREAYFDDKLHGAEEYQAEMEIEEDLEDNYEKY